MRNVTICLDDETARWVRVKAAEADKSLSRYIAELLARERVHTDEYRRAMESYLSGPLLNLGGDPMPPREERYDRDVLRDEYRRAMDEFFAEEPTMMRSDPSVPYPKREELYDRPGLR